MSIQLRDGLHNQSVDLVLEDLLSRFVVNVPDEDLSSIERVFFQVEEAQWFYTDFMRQINPALPGMKMKTFSAKLLEKCPLIWKWGDPSEAILRFGKYKSTIPVRGIALFNRELTKVVLVQGTESNAWSFPRGKISKDESDIDCAIREAEEEIGFNAKGLINENDVIERTIRGKNYKIYLAKNVPEDFNFRPVARNEIAKVSWHDLKTIQKKCRSNPNNYFILATILKPMMRWVNKNKGVSNEEELMLKAEFKLKTLLGIHEIQKPNTDAGRELLDILQGVSSNNNNSPPHMDNPQNLFQMNIPQHLYNQIPHLVTPATVPQPYQFGNPNFFPFPPNANPYFVPPQTPSFPQLSYSPSAHQSPPIIETPGKGVEGRKTTASNSRELLSILNTKPSKKADRGLSSKPENLSKPQQFLNLLNNPKDTKIENSIGVKSINPSHNNSLIGHSQPSNELEESLRLGDSCVQDQGKKLTILRRSEKTNKETENNKASADILSILGKPRIPDNSEAAIYLQDEPIDKRESELQQRSFNNPASQELLGLINNNKKETEEEGIRPIYSKVDEKKEKNSNESTESSDFEEFEEFEEFDNFDDFNEFEGPSKHSHRSINNYSTFDVQSEDEEFDNSPKYHESQFPQFQDHTEMNSFSRDFATSNTSNKVKVRILKPGESLNDLGKQTKTDNYDDDMKASNSKSLLDLLNGGDQSKNNIEPNQINNSFSSIYGNTGTNSSSSNGQYDHDFLSNLSHLRQKDAGANRNSKVAAASLLSLLGKNPSPSEDNGKSGSEERPLTLNDLESNHALMSYESQPLPASNSKSSARDLLNILKQEKPV